LILQAHHVSFAVRRCAVEASAYPFLWFFFDWLCWDEFFDSGGLLAGAQRSGRQHNVLAMATDLGVDDPGGLVEEL
jgi:hypothetical protein